MPNKLISLVFLLIFLIINNAYTENEFILPVKKPSIFKKIEKNINVNKSTSLPQKKPVLQTRPTESIKNEKKKTEKALELEEKIAKIDTGFIFPRKKPSTYKAVSEETKKSTIS